MENDSRSAWKIIYELKNDSLSEDKAEKVSKAQWYRHFSNLLHNETCKIYKDRETEILEELRHYENKVPVGHLDYKISEKEVLDACKKLKNDKASGNDMIKNEMILKQPSPW